MITVRETLSVDVVEGKGIAIRFLGSDDAEYVIQLPFGEARGLTDMTTIALMNVKSEFT